jgi:hypothetical protein
MFVNGSKRNEQSFDTLTNMAATGDSCFWLADIKTILLCNRLTNWTDHACERIGTEWAIYVEDLPYMLHNKFRITWPSGFREEDFFRNRPI